MAGRKPRCKVGPSWRTSTVLCITLYPGPHDPWVHDTIAAQKLFVCVLIPKQAMELVHQFSQHLVGLNGIFKLSKQQWPIWAVVVEDNQGHGWPVAFVFTSLEWSKVLHFTLQVLCDEIETKLGKWWTPVFMINKDDIEQGAVAALGCQYLLCEFHVQKTFREEVHKHIGTPFPTALLRSQSKLTPTHHK